jgi:hypothetical protein
MFHGTYDRAARADRYRDVAAEYNRLFKTAGDPYLASYYIRIAKDYLVRSQDELRALKREQIIGLAHPAQKCQARSSSPTPTRTREMCAE